MTYQLLVLAALLFALGVAISIVKRNLIAVLMGLELMLNAANLNLVAFARHDPAQLQGQAFALFVVVVAAAESAVALAIALKVYEHYQTAALDKINELKG